MTATMTPPDARDAKVERLNTASLRRVIEPEEEFDFAALGRGQILPDSLLSVSGLDLDLDAQTKAQLSREEVSSILDAGIRFEAVLSAGFSLQISEHRDLTDPRVAYMLHEVGEETRHSRAFARLLGEIQPKAKNPLGKGIPKFVANKVTRNLVKQPALLCVMILAGEEIPDLLQKLASEHPDTDPTLAAVNRYHRQEEARHLAFARHTLPELYKEAGFIERARVKYFAPWAIGQLFMGLVHPGVYAAVGLPGWKTWKDANATPQRRAVKYAAARGVLNAVLDGGIFKPGRVPKAWRNLCGVDRFGKPLPDAPTLDLVTGASAPAPA